MQRGNPAPIRFTSDGRHPFSPIGRLRASLTRRVRSSILGGAVLTTVALMLTMGVPVGATSLPNSAFSAVGCEIGNYSCFYAATGSQGYGYGYYGYTGLPAYAYTAAQVPAISGVYGYQYTDNRFCGDGQVTATPQGYFCTATGVPAWRSDGTTAIAPGALYPDSFVSAYRVG
jgi:hypothetical protein